MPIVSPVQRERDEAAQHRRLLASIVNDSDDAILSKTVDGTISAHDFDNVLTAIIGDCDLLIDDTSLAEPTRRDVVEIAAPNVGAAVAAPVAPRGGETILIVEDELAVRALARRMLERRGCRVLDASGPMRPRRSGTGGPHRSPPDRCHHARRRRRAPLPACTPAIPVPARP